MSQPVLGTVVQHIHRLVGREPFGELSDAELLRRFLDRRDQGAFEALVWRHAALVLGVCRRLLRHEHDAEDAFQATFLVLVRKGGRIRAGDSVAGWLHRVAWRVARKLQARLGRQARRETSREAEAVAPAANDLLGRDVRPVLDEEVDRLPEKYRRAVVLCYLEGKSNRQAAEELGCPASTLAARLTWARERLRGRLTRRGVTLSAAGVAGLLEAQASAAPPTAPVVASVVRATAAWAVEGVSLGPAAALADAAVREIARGQARAAALWLAALVVLAAGAGRLIHTPGSARATPPEPEAPAARAADEKDKAEAKEGPSLLGSVVDPSGQPVANANVWLTGGTYTYNEPPRLLASVRADAAGRFRLAYPRRGVFDRMAEVLARDAQGRVGWREYIRPEQADKPFTIKLVEVADRAGRVVDGAGRPVAGARLTPQWLTGKPEGASSGPSLELPDDLRKEYAATTADDGTFTLRGLPAGGTTVHALLSAAGFGAPHVSWDDPAPVTIRLQKAGALRGALSGTTDKKALAGVRLQLNNAAEPRVTDAGAARLSYGAAVTPEADGTFRLADVPPGKYLLTPIVEPTVPFYADKPSVFEVKPGATADVTVPLLAARKITGRVVDEVSGAGVRGAKVQVARIDERNALTEAREAVTDADGRFTAYARPGQVSAYVWQAPENYLPSSLARELPRIDSAKESVYPDIKLTPAAQVRGVVVDAAGKPVAGAGVNFLMPDLQGKSDVVSDREGQFVLDKIDPTDNVAIRARAGDAVTDGAVVVVPADLKEPVKLTVSPAHAFRLKGRVVGPDGQPVRDANVGVVWHRNYVSRKSRMTGTGGQFETCRADADGRFETKALWPGDQYQLSVSAEGFAKTETALVKGRGGEVRDEGTIALRRVGGIVRGRVIDAAGKPVAGVRVFNSGDAPRTVQTTTDAEGRFRLDGFYVGPVYVFARRAGYRFTGARTTTGADVTLTLTGVADPPPPRDLGPVVSNAERQRVAKRLLDRLWALPAKPRNDVVSYAIENMARLDPEKALLWSGETGGRWDRLARTALAERAAAAGEVDEALAHVAPLGNEEAWYALKALADRDASSNPARALRFTQEALLRVRRCNQPMRTWSLAEAGTLLIRLGKSDAGRKVLDEAAADAAKLGVVQHQALARGMVAEALGPYDLPRAKKLLEPLTDSSDMIRYNSNLAVAVGDVSLAPFDRVKMRLAQKLAATKPDEAERLAEEIQDSKLKVEALGWLAVGVAAKDPKRAWGLIDRAFDLCLDKPEDFRSWSNYGGVGTIAARLAVLAAEAGYPDRPGVVYRVLALRGTVENDSPVRVDEGNVLLAMILALVDPAAARDLLTSVEPRRHTLGSGFSGHGPREWYQAWALADPRHAATLFEKEVDASKEKGGRLPDVAPMLYLLTLPPKERERHLLRRLAGFWYPGEE